MAQIAFQNKRVTTEDGSRTWIVSGLVLPNDTVIVRELHGDVNDFRGIHAAVRRMLDSKPRYKRVLARTE